MSIINYNKTFFLKSAANLSDINIEHGIEIAFIGYSNSGKSSAINSLTNQKKLARCSKTPGCTQLINFFHVTSNFRIVDLPGYGYAKCPISIKLKWENLIDSYLKKRKLLKGLVFLMDIRNPLKVYDQNIINIALDQNIPTFILLTKCDKLTLSQQKIQFQIVYKKLKFFSKEFNIELFSSFKKIGIKKLQSQLNTWYKEYR
ncbi:YihA family ribosome biogenesis GTP-binding protein [Buchnera aphidicola (Aphis helianthi)]|uniref:Probable GTP-binding protein EngB n=1 Tax=Buchnera aphidicola (Aphis helianthi) TaxID=2315802 RepID=A0A4D6XUF9_9GAMM|nr:ribosome biogenesis GTP-binding protein YihA/YsxC [Buchnera aphidicola]QCI17241.1 YihA family ribosome biogenesis GTP-binding protein [Buchnera aphidicola (Aphis helianthi)]